MVDERGAVFSTANAPPKSVQVEENGPCRVVLRVEGDYTSADGRTLMSYIVRLTFRNGSPLVTLDFSGRVSPEELDAEVHRAVVPVVPADWYAETAAFGPVAPPTGTQFAAWDAYVAKCFEAHLALKEQQREYGFFNYGDSYGERGRNWTNNEYDFAHGLFIQFVRTGNRDYYRWALTAARHQANVDSVHAYPDPHNVGANQLHSIGHTGEWSQNLPLARWSHRYDVMTGAGNGHTWAGGMVDAWFLAGDPRVMEAAMGLGEHIVWAMSPNFKALGTHERSGGWSLHAIMVLYQAIQDPLYLEAAKRIADVALREQKFDEGGTWPHPLPKDHAGGHQGAFGNNTFLIGILLAGLRDDQRSVWGVAGDNVDVVVEVGPDFSIGGAGKARYAFFVPDTATTFKISVTGLHKGAYGAAVIAPDNQRVAMERGVHDGEAQLAWAGAGAAAPTAPPVLSGRRTIEVTPMPGQKGKVWGLVLWAAGDLALTLEGVPPYLARTQESCFSPQ